MFFFGDGTPKALIGFAVSGINAIVTYHLEVPFRYMLYQEFHELESRDGFGNESIVFMSVIVKGNIFPIIRINPGSGDDWSSKVTANVFDDP